MGVATLARIREFNSHSTGAGAALGLSNFMDVSFPAQVVLHHVLLASGSVTTTSITPPAGLVPTYLLLNRSVGSGITSELWLAYNWPVSPTNGSVVFNFTSIAYDITSWTYLFPGPVTVVPANSAVSASGTSTTADPGSITPAVNDLVIVTGGYLSATALTSYAATPSGKSFSPFTSTAQGTMRNVGGECVAEAAVAHDLAATIPSAAWAAQAVKLTPVVASNTSLLYKGFDTAALDQASGF